MKSPLFGHFALTKILNNEEIISQYCAQKSNNKREFSYIELSLIISVVRANDEILELYNHYQNIGINFIITLGIIILMYYFSLKKIDKLSENRLVNKNDEGTLSE